MPKTHYGTSYWLDRFPRSRRPAYPRHRGELTTDVAIVGAGAIGCATAYVFAAAGVDVALLEASRVAHAQARSTGIVIHEPEADFRDLVAMHGVRRARQIYQTLRRGSLEYISALRRLRIECGLQIRDAVHVAATSEGADRLEREYRARRDAGIDVAAVKGTAFSRLLGTSGFGLVTHGNASVDPYKATLGFARAAAARGAKIFEQSPALRIRSLRRAVEIRTSGGTVIASRVVVATGYPPDDFKPLRRRFGRTDGYAVLTPELPAAIRREMTPDRLIVRNAAAPDHWLHWIGSRVMFAGADQPSVPERGRERAIVQRTGQLMYELSVIRPAISGVMPEFSWDAPHSRTVDGVPYYGPHRNYPNHYFAFGGGPAGLGLSMTAARIILRHYQEQPDKADEPLSFVRIRE